MSDNPRKDSADQTESVYARQLARAVEGRDPKALRRVQRYIDRKLRTDAREAKKEGREPLTTNKQRIELRRSVLSPLELPALVLPTDSNPIRPGMGAVAPHPFRVELRNDGEETPTYEAKVYLNSNLYAGLGNWDTIAITGLDSWFTVVEGDFIYLTGSYVDNVIDSVDVDSGLSLPGRIIINLSDEEQTSWTTQIAKIIAVDGVLTVEPTLRQHLTLLSECLVIPVQYPFPLS